MKLNCRGIFVDRAAVQQEMAKLRRMQPPFEGGCLCGSIRYRCDESPFWSSNCYCQSCQKLGGGANTTAFTVRAKSFNLLSGELIRFARTAGSGNIVQTVRCKHCGTWVYSEREGKTEWISILASTLDNPENFVPISNVYVSHAVPWAYMDSSLMNFNRMPEDEI
ncbi:MAG: GFA family protein [Pseudomonadota bacterium]